MHNFKLGPPPPGGNLHINSICAAISLNRANSSRPCLPAETSWLIKEKLGLSKEEKLASTREAYGALMDKARNSRIFYPLSSFYLKNELAKVMMSRSLLPACAKESPRARHPW